MNKNDKKFFVKQKLIFQEKQKDFSYLMKFYVRKYNLFSFKYSHTNKKCQNKFEHNNKKYAVFSYQLSQKNDFEAYGLHRDHPRGTLK